MKAKRKRGRPYKDHSRREYARTRNPYLLMSEFMRAYSWRVPVPEWVSDELYRKFREYGDQRGKRSLDDIFGTKPGKGARNPYEEYERGHRDLFLMHYVYEIKCYYKMTAPDAAAVMVAFLHANREYHEWYIPSSDTVAKMYSREKPWKSFEDAGFKPGGYSYSSNQIPLAEEFREHIPDEIKAKYGIQKESPYPKDEWSALIAKNMVRVQEDILAGKIRGPRWKYPPE